MSAVSYREKCEEIFNTIEYKNSHKGTRIKITLGRTNPFHMDLKTRHDVSEEDMLRFVIDRLYVDLIADDFAKENGMPEQELVEMIIYIQDNMDVNIARKPSWHKPTYNAVKAALKEPEYERSKGI